MNKQQLKKITRERAKERVKNAEISKEVVDAVVDLVFETIEKTVLEGEAVSIYNFGKFYLAPVGKRIGRNLKTGETITIPERKKFSFTAAKKIRFVEK